MIPGLLLTAAIVVAWCYAPRLCDRLADAAEQQSRPLTDLDDPRQWDELAAREPWRSTLEHATRRRERAA